MPNSMLTLGSFSFDGLESPERILLKSKHRLVVHRLGSGSSSIDSLGEDPEIVSFRGIFTGINAAARSRTIEQLRSQGVPVNLTWNSKTLSVVIRDFELNYSSNQWIPYKLSCYVMSSPGGWLEISTSETSVSADTQINNIVNLLNNTGINPTSDQLTALGKLAMLNFDIAPSGALQETQELCASIDDRLTSLELVSSIDPMGLSGIPHAEASSMIGMVSNTGQLAALVLARNHLMSISVSAEAVNQQ
jgi:hypothetical protein